MHNFLLINNERETFAILRVSFANKHGSFRKLMRNLEILILYTIQGTSAFRNIAEFYKFYDIYLP